MSRPMQEIISAMPQHMKPSWFHLTLITAWHDPTNVRHCSKRVFDTGQHPCHASAYEALSTRYNITYGFA